LVILSYAVSERKGFDWIFRLHETPMLWSPALVILRYVGPAIGRNVDLSLLFIPNKLCRFGGNIREVPCEM